MDNRQKTGEKMKVEWVDGFEIQVKIQDGTAVISANKEGLLSLAKQLTALAEGMPGDHIHYDEHNSLEDGSSEMVVERIQ
ncbi:MAG: hypothetical protein IKE36_01160 [Solobacterium sp.]|nr:hypothetical protein [Solobacterium sp.]